MKTLALAAAAFVLAGCVVVAGSRAVGPDDFEAIRVGMSQEQTLQLLGRPYDTMHFSRLRQTSWDYRHVDRWGYLALFSVIFNDRGEVVGTFTQRLNDGRDFGGNQ